MEVVVGGASGFLGSALVPALRDAGHTVRRLVRREAASPDEIPWDPVAGRLDPAALATADAVVNLSGAQVAPRRWTAARRRVLLDSRLGPTRLLAGTLAGLLRPDAPPPALLSASAVGVYGTRGDEEITEDTGPGDGFLAELVQAWEAATRPAEDAGVRTVHLRSGLVLGRTGGLLPVMMRPFRLGLGGRVGHGRQWMSWIALPDHVAAVAHLLADDRAAGPVNLTAPEPVRNAELTRVLGRVLRRPARLPVPATAFRLALGRQMADETVLGGQRVLPARLDALGFPFRHRQLEPALRDVLEV